MTLKILWRVIICTASILIAVQLSACTAPGYGSSPPSTTALVATSLTTTTVFKEVPVIASPLTVTDTVTVAVTHTLTRLETQTIGATVTLPVSSSVPTSSTITTSFTEPAAKPTVSASVILPPPSDYIFPVSGFADPTGDTFDAAGNPAAAEACIDIRDADISMTVSGYRFSMRVEGVVPISLSDQAKAAEWDFFLDTDLSGTTGERSPLFINDIGAEYMLRLLVHGIQNSAELINLVSLQATPVPVTVSVDTVIFNVPGSALSNLTAFDCVALARSWQNNTLVAADKTPGQGSYSFPG